MSDWNPSLYSRFEDERSRPALEMLKRVCFLQAARLMDTGCGSSGSIVVLALRSVGAKLPASNDPKSRRDTNHVSLPRVALLRSGFELGTVFKSVARHAIRCSVVLGSWKVARS
jgi:trans-aconitate methyltransferase